MVARVDKTTDPQLLEGLLLARRGQAYFSRKVNELTDDEFDGASLLPGWSRRRVVAHVGLNARALTRLTHWAATGEETPMYESPTQRAEEIEFVATLPVQALRNLSDHAAIHLNVEWRDLEEDQWRREVRTAQSRIVPAAETVWMRTREVWIHAVDLDNGGSFDDFPPALLDHLLEDVLGAWERRRAAEDLPLFVFTPDDRPPGAAIGRSDAIQLRGTAARLAAWATGRGVAGVQPADGANPPPPPRWL